MNNTNNGTSRSFGGQLYDGIVDARGIETKFVKDTLGFISTIIDGLGQSTTIERNSYGDPTKITRPDGSLVTFTYNQYRDIVEQHDSSTNVHLAYNYDSFGNLLSHIDELGVESTQLFDVSTGDLLKKQRLSQFVEYEYLPGGLLARQQNNNGESQSWSYDLFGNAVAMTDATGVETNYIRDAAGNIIQAVDGKGNKTLNTFDAFNRLLSVTSPKLETTSYLYLATGELANVTDPALNQTDYLYNNLGQLVQKIDPLGRSHVLSYDESGNLTQETDPQGNVKSFEYDALNRLTRKILPDNSYTLQYDIRNNITRVTDLYSQIDYSYIATKRGYLVASETVTGQGIAQDYPAHHVSYSYDISGNRITTNSSVIGQSTYTYDQHHRLSSLLNHRGQSFTFAWDASSRLASVTSPIGESTLSFDAASFLTKLEHKNSNQDIISSFEYQRDALGNRIQMRTPAENYNYSYDLNSQLINASSPEAGLETFVYDPLGNRLADQFGNYVYDQKKQLLEEDAFHIYTYDSNGNLSARIKKDLSQTMNLVHNSENRLIGIKFYQGNALTKEVTYVYDAVGRRIQKKISNGSTLNYLYDGSEVIAQMDSSHNLLSSYTHSTLRTDDPLSVYITSAGVAAGLAQTTGDFYYLKDALGSVVDIADISGEVIQHHGYLAFGKLVSIKDGNGNDISDAPMVAPYFTYTARGFDAESGFYFYRARYYSPEIGRFIQTDPDSGFRNQPLTHVNKYIYVLNNPIMLNDPSGHSFLKDVGGAIGGVLSNKRVQIAILAIALTVALGPAGTGAAVGWGAGIGAGAGLAYGLATGKNTTEITSLVLLGSVAGASVGGGYGSLGNTGTFWGITAVAGGISYVGSGDSEGFLTNFAFYSSAGYAGANFRNWTEGKGIGWLSDLAAVRAGIIGHDSGYNTARKDCKSEYHNSQEGGSIAGFLCGVSYVVATLLIPR